MEPSSHILDLFKRYQDGVCTLRERAELMAFLADERNEEGVKEIISAQIVRVDTGGLSEAIVPATLAKAPSVSVTDTVPTPIRRINRLIRLWSAAAALLLCSVGVYLWTTRPEKTSPTTLTKSIDIAPGHEGALLTLADGRKVLLDTIQDGVVALQGGATARVKKGVLHYEGMGTKVLYNTMSTLKGQQFRLTLPDGTAIWLNSMSSIRYPTVFAGTQRQVEITGELYFEVAKGRQPFIVTADGRTEIAVLGTHFNINAYPGEHDLNTTLLEGSVRVTHGTRTVQIRPGQQAQVLAGDIKIVSEINTEQVIAWKNGLFNFEGLRLDQVMRQLERWYDIEVIYENGIPDVPVGGEMSKDVTLQGLLIVLDKLGIHYRLEGRRLTIFN